MAIRSLKVTVEPLNQGRQMIKTVSLPYTVLTKFTGKVQLKLLNLLKPQLITSVLFALMILPTFTLSSCNAFAQSTILSNGYLADNNKRMDDIITPKIGLMFNPWKNTEFYLNGGLGFHSNDALRVETRIRSGSGKPVISSTPSARTYGAGLGLRLNWSEGWQSTVSAWWLDIDSEPLFESDTGSDEGNRPSRRYGVEWRNYYSPVEWLSFDTSVSFSRSRFRDDEEGLYIPGAIESVVAVGATFHDLYGGFFGNTRLRYLGPRPLIEDNSAHTDSTFILSAMLGYQFNPDVSVQAEVFNLLNLKDSQIDNFYRSRLPGADVSGLNDLHFHPVEPLSFRMSLIINF